MLNEIGVNLAKISRRINEAASKSGRDPQDIKLVAVSKNMDVERIRKAMDAGLSLFGENKVQEFTEKYGKIGNEVEWHFVGNLQRNKVKDVVGKVDLIHSLGRMPLAKEINKRAKQKSTVTNVLLQVNISGEESKSGFSLDDVLPSVHSIVESCPHIAVKGLMTIAPLTEDPETVRPVFAELRKLSEVIEGEGFPSVDMDYLSMGMTNDFRIAVEEGANLLRIGRAIFGSR
ncbi:MAG: YggS family pyridoxal phosphate-dependent enzyme [Clostridia bacterium]|nr:YggS family pyridoxal phosphate-dependent enzyme [Clostridia bacterium]